MMNLERVLAGPRPYPGLRPFDEGELDIFFGREHQTDKLLEKLQDHRFLAVVGPSGCGKSSLVNAGLIPGLQTGFMADAGSKWFIARMRPGERPFERLAEALVRSKLLSSERALLPEAQALTEAALRRGPLGLLEIAAESGLKGRGNLLVLVDQFEELFRLGREVKASEAAAFVSLLLRSAHEPLARIYVAIGMRSDYLGECATFHGLPEAINEGQYLAPNLTREECALAISGPARVFGASVDASLLNRLLNDFGPESDQLPLLQHALMRMWNLRPEDDGHAGNFIVIESYEAIGGLASALSSHADEAFNELSPADQKLAKTMFQRLSDARSAKRDIRAPARVSEIACIAGVDEADVIRVANCFRRDDRCFLTPRADEPLDGETLLDVSHESFLRQWHRLVSWVEEEAENASLFQRVKDTARAWRKKQARLWGDPDLERALAWKSECGAPAWAARYGSADEYALACEFLEESRRERDEQRTREAAAAQRELQRIRRVAKLSAGTALALAAGIAVYLLLFVFEHVAHFNNTVKINGIPHGIGRLSASDVGHRALSVRLTRAGYWGRVLRLEYVNHRGERTPAGRVGSYFGESEETPDNKKPAFWEYGYDKDGRIAYERGYGQSGNSIVGFVYVSSPGAKGERSGYYVGSDGLPNPEPGRTARVAIRYAQSGHEQIIRFLGADGQPTVDTDKAFGKAYVYDEAGNQLEETSLDRAGRPMSDAYGNATMRCRFDALGNQTECVALDTVGKLVVAKDGWARVKFRRDQWGNELERAYYDDAGEPVDATSGYHRARSRYDRHGNAFHTAFFALDDSPTTDERGCHVYSLGYDAHGRLVRSTCMNDKQAITAAVSGCATEVFGLDQRGNYTSWECLDERGGAVVGKEGFSSWRRRFDGDGNVVHLMHYGTDGRPVVGDEGSAGWNATYDAAGRSTAVFYLGTTGEPVMTSRGYAKVVKEYDGFGCVSAESYFDVQGKPTLHRDGYAGWRARCDKRSNRTELTYLGPRGDVVFSTGGYAGWRSEYDGFGNEVAVRYLGRAGELIATPKGGVAGWKSTFDGLGRRESRTYFDHNEKVTVGADGIAQSKTKYDPRGHEIDVQYYGVDGRPAMLRTEGASQVSGYARRTRSVDSRGNPLEERYYGVDGERVLTSEEFHSARHRFDPKGRALASYYYGLDGLPVLAKRGYHAVLRVYDEYGRVLVVRYVGMDGESAVVGADGYARVDKSYTVLGQLAGQAIFGADGRPVSMPDGIHRSERIYDGMGRLSEEINIGLPNKPLTVPHRIAHAYDVRGTEIAVSYFDAAGKPVRDEESGCAKQQFDSDPQGHTTEVRCLGQGGELTANSAGIGIRRFKYGPRGELVEEAYFAPTGRPLATAAGYAMKKQEYDLLGRVVGMRYFDARGEPTLAREYSAAYVKQAYDERGNVTQEELFGVDGNPRIGALRYHRIRFELDARGRVIEVNTFDTNQRPTRNAQGYAHLERSYGGDGTIEWECIDKGCREPALPWLWPKLDRQLAATTSN